MYFYYKHRKNRLIDILFPLKVRGEHAVRRPRHLCVPRGLAVGSAAGAGPRNAGPKRRHHLLHDAHVHIHSRTRSPSSLQRGRRHPTNGQHQLAFHDRQHRGSDRRNDTLRLQQHV